VDVVGHLDLEFIDDCVGVLLEDTNLDIEISGPVDYLNIVIDLELDLEFKDKLSESNDQFLSSDFDFFFVLDDED
jgi:hypothetical protein